MPGTSKETSDNYALLSFRRSKATEESYKRSIHLATRFLPFTAFRAAPHALEMTGKRIERMFYNSKMANINPLRILRPSGLTALFIFIVMLVAGCGYHIAGQGGKMPGGIESVSIPIFTNSTAKPDIESTVTQAFVNEFVNTLHVTTDNDVVMRGTINSYELTAVSYTQNDVNQEYRLTVTLSLVLVKGGDILWEDNAISNYEDFAVTITDVTATNEAELAALKKIAEDTARFTKERMLEKF